MRTAVWIGVILALLFVWDFTLNNGRGLESMRRNIGDTLGQIVD